MPDPEARPSRSVLGYFAVSSLLVLAGLDVMFGTVRFPAPGQAAQFAWTFLGLLIAAGCAGAFVGAKLGLPEIWLPPGSLRQRLLVPFALGSALALPLVLLDLFFGTSAMTARALGIPELHMPPPESFLIYPAAAVMVETMLRLVPVPLLTWLGSRVLLRGRSQEQVYWVVAAVLAAVEPYQQGGVFRGHPGLLAFYLPFGYLVALIQMYWFRKEGFLASLAIRVGDYLIWHVLWGGFLLPGMA